jgi:flagellar basal-body rod modification protein FlgD
MSTISDTIQSLSSTTTTSASSSSTDTSDEIMGKEDFLTLLVAQLKNQDPLDPDDPTDFTAQLAQFSSLEQLFNLNESLDTLVNSQQESDQLNGTDLIGKDVVYEGNAIEFNGDPIEIGYELEEAATALIITIQDENGATVSTITPSELDTGTHFIEWDGMDSSGNVLADGNYVIDIQVDDGSGVSSAITPLIRSEVTGVELDSTTNSTNIVTLAGTVNLSGISAVYDNAAITLSETETAAITEDNSTESTELESETSQDTVSSDITEATDADTEQIAQDSLTYYLNT